MPRLDCVKSVVVERTPRVLQLEGLFDIPPPSAANVAGRSICRWSSETGRSG